MKLGHPLEESHFSLSQLLYHSLKLGQHVWKFAQYILDDGAGNIGAITLAAVTTGGDLFGKLSSVA